MTGMACTADPTAPQVPLMARDKWFAAELNALRDRHCCPESGYEGVGPEVGHRGHVRRDEACRLACGRIPEHTAQSNTPGVAGIPGFQLVIGVDGDPRAWVRVANALLDRIASGVVRAGSRVPQVTALGLVSPVAPGTAARAFRMLTGEGVLCWVPGRAITCRPGSPWRSATGRARTAG